MRGESAGALYGLPVSIKDLEPVAGLRCTFGSKFFADYIADSDGLVTEHAKAAGGIVIGKTNTSHYGHKDMCDNLLGPPCRNPWRLDRTSGASSGRRRSGCGRRTGTPGARLGRSGLHPHSRRVVRRLRSQAILRARTILAQSRHLGSPHAQRSAYPHGRRRGPLSRRPGRPRPARPHNHRQPTRGLRRRGGTAARSPKRAARRLERRPGLRRGRPGGAASDHCSSRSFQRLRMRSRGRQPWLGRPARGRSHDLERFLRGA